MDNVICVNGKQYNLEKIWRRAKKVSSRDCNGKLLPYPKNQSNKWPDQQQFINQLSDVQQILNDIGEYKTYEKTSDCLLCNIKNVTTKHYKYKRTYWDDGLLHYIGVHNIEPNITFKELIYGFSLPNLPQKYIPKYDTFVKIDKNQMLILDALMIHGGHGKKYENVTKKGHYKFSEHAGLLGFDDNMLAKIIVSCNTLRVDDDDEEIYFPENLSEMLEYEYIFHTHPPTPSPGGRVSDGILYEFPSIGDILHFIYHHNNGKVIGSLVVTSEGLYNIRKIDRHIDKIKINEDALFHSYQKYFYKIQDDAISKFGSSFDTNVFFSEIAQDDEYIKNLNAVIRPFGLIIDYYPRKRDRNRKWIIDTVFLIINSTKY